MSIVDQSNTSGQRLNPIRHRKKLKKQALHVVNFYTALSGGMGLIPVSIFYQLAVAGILSKMLYDLSKLYGTTLSKQKNKAIIAAVLGGAHAEWIPNYLGVNAEKVLPGLSSVGIAMARPVVGAGITYAIGRLFVHHFETGAWLRDTPPPQLSVFPAKQLGNNSEIS